MFLRDHISILLYLQKIHHYCKSSFCKSTNESSNEQQRIFSIKHLKPRFNETEIVHKNSVGSQTKFLQYCNVF